MRGDLVDHKALLGICCLLEFYTISGLPLKILPLNSKELFVGLEIQYEGDWKNYKGSPCNCKTGMDNHCFKNHI